MNNTDKLKLHVEHVITEKTISDKTYQVVLYLNAETPYEYEYHVNSMNNKTKTGGGAGYDRLDWALESFNKKVYANEKN